MMHRDIKKIKSLILSGILLSQTVLPCFAMDEVWKYSMGYMLSQIEELPPEEREYLTQGLSAEQLKQYGEEIWEETKEQTLIDRGYFAQPKVNQGLLMDKIRAPKKQQVIITKKDKERNLLLERLNEEKDMEKRVAILEEEVRKKADRGDSLYQCLYGTACLTGALDKTETLSEDRVRTGLDYLNKSINSTQPSLKGLFDLGIICLGNYSYYKTPITIPSGMPGFSETGDDLKLRGFDLIKKAADLGFLQATNYIKEPVRYDYFKGEQGESLGKEIIINSDDIAKENQAIARARAAKDARAKEAANAFWEELDKEEERKTQKAEAQKKKQQELKKKAEVAKQKKVKEDAAAQKKKEDLEKAKALKVQQEEAKRIKEEAQKAKQALEIQKKAQREAQKQEDKRKREEVQRVKGEEVKREKEKKRQAQLAEEEKKRAKKAAKKQENIVAQEKLRVAAQKKREQKALEKKNREEKAEQQKNNAPVHAIEVNPDPVREQTAIVPAQEMLVQNELQRQLAIQITEGKQPSNEKKEVKKKKNKMESLSDDFKHASEVVKEVLYKPIVQPIFGPTMTQVINMLNVSQAVEILSTNYMPGSTIPSRTDHVWEEGTDEQGTPVLTKKRQISYLFNGTVHQKIVPLNGPEIIDPLIKLSQEVSDENKTAEGG